MKLQMKRFLRTAVCFFIGFAAWIMLSWLSANYLAVEKPLQSADAILVLSGSDAYGERADEAARLFKEKIARKIFLTNDGLQGGWNQKEQRNPYFIEIARWRLIARGVPAEAIEMLPEIVTGTGDEANLLVKVSAERNLKSLLLVTSAYHTRRTLWTFQRAASRNNLPLEIGIKFPLTAEKTLLPFGSWFSIKVWKTVGVEYAKIVYYWLVY
jgi:uncharacterized SAM-binding protein YcdF (DUF218 family)